MTADKTDIHTDASIAVVPVGMTRIQVRLGDLGLAKENLRAHEPADGGVPQLAETSRLISSLA